MAKIWAKKGQKPKNAKIPLHSSLHTRKLPTAYDLSVWIFWILGLLKKERDGAGRDSRNE